MRQFLLSLLLLIAVSAHAADDKVGIAAVVNDRLISTLDVEDRVNMIIGTTGLSDTGEIRAKLRPQVLRALVDETLQLDEAAAQGVDISEKEIDRAVAGIEKQQGKSPGSLRQFLTGKGIPVRSFEQQLRAQLAWTRTVTKVMRSRTNITDAEVEAARRRMASSSVGQEVQLVSVLLPVDAPEHEESVKNLAEKLVSEIKGGVDFSAIAAQFSGGVSPEPFWVPVAQLDPRVAGEVAKIKPGEITNPIRTDSGYQIIRLVNQKSTQSNALAEADSEVALKQIVFALREDAKQKEVGVLMEIAQAVAKHPGSCGETSIAGMTDAEDAEISVNIVRVPFSKLSGAVRQIVSTLKVGGISEPFATPKGLQLLMLCEKIDMPLNLPEKDKVRDRLMQEKLDLAGVRYMRNLRREAFIEIRNQ